ncbi:hypothetical protein EEL50_12790 [Muribaculaceae bacterium Isolate-105 (HZI)]|nr:hypothetical protein EEL50_12790 [Muribaculaceae bacterium Isolate-105 (HZI)]
MKFFELLRQGWPFFVQVRTANTREHKASAESRQDRDTLILEVRENVWRLTGADADGKQRGT